MVVFDILQKLSFSSGEKLLLEEGYVEENVLSMRIVRVICYFFIPIA